METCNFIFISRKALILQGEFAKPSWNKNIINNITENLMYYKNLQYHLLNTC
jgi:hypothetical protein